MEARAEAPPRPRVVAPPLRRREPRPAPAGSGRRVGPRAPLRHVPEEVRAHGRRGSEVRAGLREARVAGVGPPGPPVGRRDGSRRRAHEVPAPGGCAGLPPVAPIPPSPQRAVRGVRVEGVGVRPRGEVA